MPTIFQPRIVKKMCNAPSGMVMVISMTLNKITRYYEKSANPNSSNNKLVEQNMLNYERVELKPNLF